MRVCIVTTELLGVGASGGNGVGARALGQHLAASGNLDIHVIVPCRHRQLCEFPRMSGLSVRTYNRWDLAALAREVRAADADVYHYVQASMGAWLGQWVMPDRAHVVECVDPRDWNDWQVDFRLPTHSPSGSFRLSCISGRGRPLFPRGALMPFRFRRGFFKARSGGSTG